MLLAKRVIFICGTQTLCGEDLDICSDYHFDLGLPDNSTWLRRGLWIRGANFDFQSLYWTLCLYRSRLCADPRDKIYALLSISKYDTDVIIPNYNLSVGVVYQQAAIALMKEDRNLLGIFHGPRFHNSSFAAKETLGFIPAGYQTFQSMELTRVACFMATNMALGTLSSFNFDFSQVFSNKFPYILKLKGLFFSKVLSRRLKADPKFEGWQDIVRKWELQDLEGIKYVTRDDGIDCYWRTLFLNIDNECSPDNQKLEKIQGCVGCVGVAFSFGAN